MYKTKRILEVRIIRELDTDADTSYLGEYSNTAASEYAIDRRHSLDCPINAPLSENDVLCVLCGQSKAKHNNFTLACPETESKDQDWVEDSEFYPEDPANGCNCGGHNISSREYRYFNPATVEPFNETAAWFPQHSPECNTQKGFKAGEICNCHSMSTSEKYAYWRKTMLESARKDYERMESLNAGDWCYIGIRAQARVQLTSDLVQTITSGGLWGIESDSDESYLKEVESEQLAELKSQLRAIGFSTRAISKAFKSITEERP